MGVKRLDTIYVFWYCNTIMPVNSILHMSDAALIAVHALSGLASVPGGLVQAKELAAAIGASENHLSKVMQRLVRAGLVHSVKGPNGGFRLAKEASSISFRNAMEAVDGPLTGDFCPFSTEHCDAGNCIFGSEISKRAAEMVAYLGERTIADIAGDAAARVPPPYTTAGQQA